MAPVKTRWLLSAVARLTGVDSTSVNEGKRFRIEVDTVDGHRHAVHLQVDDHPKETRPYAINQIADALCIDRQEILVALDEWTPAELMAHLQKQTKLDLTPPRNRP